MAAIARSMSSAVVKTPGLKRTAPRVDRAEVPVDHRRAVDAHADRDPEVAVEDGAHIQRVHALDVRGEDGDVAARSSAQ